MQDDVLLAFQLCFDLFENESQAFNFKVRLSSTSVCSTACVNQLLDS